MVFQVSVTIILFLLVASGLSQQSACPPGFVPANASNSAAGGILCTCSEVWNHFNSSHTVRCSPSGSTIKIYTGHCVTYNESTNSFFVGACPFNLNFETLVFLLSNLSEWGDEMCGPFNRKGRLCGECLSGFWPSITRSMDCVRCDAKFSWLKFIIIQAVLPSCALFIVIVVLNVQLSSSPLNALVLYCQLMFGCLYYDIRLGSLVNDGYSKPFDTLAQIMMHCYGIFNLEFLYLSKYSQPCSGRSMKGIHILMLKYFEASTPLLLLLLVSLCAYLYSRNFKPFVLVWRGISKIVSATCIKNNTQRWTSERLCNAFIAFFSLAYSKILYVSLNLLIPNRIYEIRGTVIVDHWNLYFDPTIEYFGREHIPYAVAAILVLILFVVFPLLLLVLYLFKPVGTLYSRILGSKWHVMSYFIDAFQGWYRNGTDNTSRDYRLVFAVFPVLKILYAVWITVFTGIEYRGSRIWLLPCMVLQGTGLFFVMFRPYRIESMNKMDALILWVLGTAALTLVNTGKALMHFSLVLAYIPLLGVSVYATYKVCYWVKRQMDTTKCCSCCCFRRQEQQIYPPLLHNRLDSCVAMGDGYEHLD